MKSRQIFRFLYLVIVVCISPLVRAAEPSNVSRVSPGGATVSEPARSIPVTHRADVVVIGAGEGGLGGCTAAIAAARHGASALLVEERSYIGLHVPIALGVVIGIKGWQPTIHEGLLREFAEATARTGQYNFQPVTPAEILDRGEIIIRHHDVASTAMLGMLQKAGVPILFHCKFVDTVVEDGRVMAIIVESPQSRHAIAGQVFIDSTGLADVAAKSGAPMLREEPFMSVQAFIGGVDESRYKHWLHDDNQPLDDSFKAWIEKLVGPLAGQHFPWDQWWPEYLGARMPPAVVRKAREAQEKGELTLIHRRGKDGIMGIVEGIKANSDVAMPRTYITGIDPLNVDDVSWAETTSRIALMEFQQFLLKYIPGFEKSVLERVADTVSLRGSRYIEIDKPITRDQIDRGATNTDCIYVFGRGTEKSFEVPYRALVPKKVQGLLVVGKATAGGAALRQAHGVLFQGQAAGTAAAMAVKQGVAPRHVDISQLQAALKADGVAIPYPRTEQKSTTSR
jgi:hypothetical protein